jgi:hypothetical protein
MIGVRLDRCRGLRRGFLCVAALALFAPLTARAADSADPLRLVPASADLVVKVEHPRAVADLAVKLAGTPELAGFRGYRDYFESTNYRLFRQLVGHFERELGSGWPDLVDELAGGGVVLALKFGKKDPEPAVIVIQGRDAKLMEKFFHKLLDVAEQELARQGLHDVYTKESYRGIETYRRGDDIHAAVLGAALVYSNRLEGLHSAIDLHLDPSKESLLQKKSLVDARPLVPGDALAWVWISLDYAHKSEELKPLFALPANFFPFQVTFGGLLDSLRRSPFLVIAFREHDGTATLSLRLPSGTKGMHDIVRAHVPPENQVGALPLLSPEGVLYSVSYYLDLGWFWNKRAVLLPPDQLKQAEQFDKTSKGFLYGTAFSQLLDLSGTHQRFVVVKQQDRGYTFKAPSYQPAYALVLEPRDVEAFAKALDGPLGGLSFLAGLKAPMTKFEEDHGHGKISGYRFVENDANKSLGDGVLFNFTPCRARVGNQYIISSTVDLARLLVDEIEKTNSDKTSSRQPASDATSGPVTHQSRLSFAGLSDYLAGTKKQLITQNMLQQGNTAEDAEKEVSLFLGLLDHLGRVETTTRYLPDQYQFDAKIVP